MRDLGYVEGQNLIIDVRWPQGTFDQDPALFFSQFNAVGAAGRCRALDFRFRLANGFPGASSATISHELSHRAQAGHEFTRSFAFASRPF